MDADPRSEYERRRRERQTTADRLAARYRAVLRARTAIVFVIVATAWLGEKEPQLHLLLTPPAVLCIISVVVKNYIYRAWQRALQAVRFYDRRLGNLDEAWTAAAETGERFLDDAHLYARDLDLFGAGSLYQRLHLAGTPLGETTLATWLRTPASAEEIRARQAAVAELRDRLDLREALALMGQAVPRRLNASDVCAWAATAAPSRLSLARLAAFVGTAFALLTLAAFVCGFSGIPLATMLIVNGTVTLLCQRSMARRKPIVHAAELRPLVPMLTRLRRESFVGARLRGIQTTLADSGRLASLARLLSAETPARFAFPLLGTVHLALAVETWRLRHGHALMRWLAALGELEALHALAAYAFESPGDPFADIVTEGACFEAVGLGHPLLPADRVIRNDVRLHDECRLLIVSGSNMSGKSTLLRAVGVNAVLALAGAPVRAARLRIAPLAMGATLRFQDSLLDGRSRFFAEVTRVRAVLDHAATRPPLLFLFDELFSGTNSDDRRCGAEAVLRRLLERGALGVVTTHDLALTHLAEVLAPHAVNVHFADHLADDGTMIFDYQMRDGVLAHGNGVALMRAVGIEI